MQKNNKKKILITGSTGLIGKEIVKIVDSEKYDICAVDSKSFDIFDKRRRRKYLSVEHPDFLLHFAWITTGDYLSSPINWEWKRNSLELFEEFIEFGGKKIIGFGTCFEYDCDTKGIPISEEQLLNPLTEYAKAKVELFEDAMRLCKDKNVQFIWGRIFYAYGVGEKTGRLMRSSIDSFKNKERYVLKFGQLRRDYIFSKDIAHMVLKLIESDYFGAINLCTGEEISLQQLILGLAELMRCEELADVRCEETNQPPIIVGDKTLLNKVIGEYDCMNYVNALKTILTEEGVLF